MEMNEMVKLQKDFSAKHGWIWETKNEKETLERLNFGTIALIGECGEFANLVKKTLRDKSKLTELLPHIREELTDVMIYTMLLSVTLSADMENELKAKMKKNEEKFKNFRKDGEEK